MKAGVHPLYQTAKVICACGNTFETRSTKDVVKLEICSACHPFYTGQQRFIDTAGRVERFKTRFKSTDGKTVARAPVKGPVRKVLSAPQRKQRVLSTAPRKEEKTEKKSPAKKA